MPSIQSDWLIFGDSIACGVATHLGVKRSGNGKKKDGYGISKVGANPKTVLGFLKEWDVKSFDGKVVILSTGYTNSARQPEDAKKWIKQMLQLLKDANAAVAVMGVCKSTTNYKTGLDFPDVNKVKVKDLNIPAGNTMLEEVALAYEQTFIQGFGKSLDGLHPADYSLWWDTAFKDNMPLARSKKEPDANAVADEGAKVAAPTLTEKAEPAKDAGTDKKEEVVDPPADSIPNPFSVHGKITLKKVSGPGDLIGVVEKDITNVYVNRGVEFSDISFSKGGDYEISVVSDSPDVEPYTFKISVANEPDFIEQPSTKTEQEQPKGTQPCIAQVFPPTVVIPPMEMDLTGDDELDADLVTNTGIKPHIQVFGSTLKADDIMSMKLYHDGILPKCNVMFRDSLGVLKTTTAEDDSTFDLFIDSRDPNLKSIHMQFKIEKFSYNQAANNFSMAGSIHIPEGGLLYLQNYDCFEGTSMDALKSICKKLGIGFNTNIDSTDDSMNWVFNGYKTYEAMKNILDHAYITDKSFIWGYIDYYYCFNFIDVEKELARSIAEDRGVETGSGKDKTIFVPIELTNEPSSNGSCFYFDKQDIRNKSTAKSLETGYLTKVKYYDQSQKKMLIFDVDGNTSDQSQFKILKGTTNDTAWYNQNFKTDFKGTLVTSNVHKNYHYATALNKRNLDDLQKITLVLSLPHMNLNIYKGMKLNVQMMNLAPNVQDPADVNFEYSGPYIVSDIVYLNTSSGFEQKVILVRRELGKKPEEVVEPIKPKEVVEEKETTVNPEPIKFNKDYNVGDTYAFIDGEGKLYYVNVKTKSDDGKTMTGIIKQESPKEVVYEDREDDNYDTLDDEFIEETAMPDDESMASYLDLKFVQEDRIKAEQEAANLPPLDPNAPNPFEGAQGSGVVPSESGLGYPVNKSTTDFVNKWCNGIYPAKQHPDGTFVIINGKKNYDKNGKLKGLHMLSANPEYTRRMVKVVIPLAPDKKTGKERETKVEVHPAFAKSLNLVMAEVLQKGLRNAFRTSAGGLCVRNVTGGTRLSNHAYGFAIDMNAADQGYNYYDYWDLAAKKIYYCKVARTPSKGYGVRDYNADDIAYLEIVQIMAKYGVGWLGEKGNHDPMHFSIHEVRGKDGI